MELLRPLVEPFGANALQIKLSLDTYVLFYQNVQYAVFNKQIYV